MNSDLDNLERIWLEPVEDVDPFVGRQWSRDQVWPKGVEYVRADIAPSPSSHVEDDPKAAMSLAVALDFADNPRPYHTLQAPADTNGELYRALATLAKAYRDTPPQTREMGE